MTDIITETAKNLVEQKRLSESTGVSYVRAGRLLERHAKSQGLNFVEVIQRHEPTELFAFAAAQSKTQLRVSLGYFHALKAAAGTPLVVQRPLWHKILRLGL